MTGTTKVASTESKVSRKVPAPAPSRDHFTPERGPVNHILHLQQTAGNQALQRMAKQGLLLTGAAAHGPSGPGHSTSLLPVQKARLKTSLGMDFVVNDYHFITRIAEEHVGSIGGADEHTVILVDTDWEWLSALGEAAGVAHQADNNKFEYKNITWQFRTKEEIIPLSSPGSSVDLTNGQIQTLCDIAAGKISKPSGKIDGDMRRALVALDRNLKHPKVEEQNIYEVLTQSNMFFDDQKDILDCKDPGVSDVGKLVEWIEKHNMDADTIKLIINQ